MCRAAPPGFRDAGDFNGYGTLFYVGRRGYGWSSTGAGTNATTCTSTTAFSPDRPTKRPVGARRILPSSRAWPNPLGENQSLSSPPLEPRRLLLSVMRQKVGKERSQGVFAPLAIPRRNGPNLAEKNPVFVCRAAPAPGFRDSGYNKGYGAVRNVGSTGYSWAASVESTNAYFLSFHFDGIGPQNISHRAVGLQLRCLQEEGYARHTNASAARVRCPVGARPSRGESISFLSPARAAGAPTFCDATESRQRTQPRGLRPLG